MIEYLINALGLSDVLISSDFSLFAGLIIVIITIFGISKVIFILFKAFFGGEL